MTDRPVSAEQKLRYVRFSFEGDSVTVMPETAKEFIESGEWEEYSHEDVWMTEREFQEMPDV